MAAPLSRAGSHSKDSSCIHTFKQPSGAKASRLTYHRNSPCSHSTQYSGVDMSALADEKKPCGWYCILNIVNRLASSTSSTDPNEAAHTHNIPSSPPLQITFSSSSWFVPLLLLSQNGVQIKVLTRMRWASYGRHSWRSKRPAASPTKENRHTRPLSNPTHTISRPGKGTKRHRTRSLPFRSSDCSVC